jgi:hypothetical protein
LCCCSLQIHVHPCQHETAPAANSKIHIAAPARRQTSMGAVALQWCRLPAGAGYQRAQEAAGRCASSICLWQSRQHARGGLVGLGVCLGCGNGSGMLLARGCAMVLSD